MTDTRKLNSLTKVLMAVVLIVHFSFFMLEAVLWMQPAVYASLVVKLNNPIDLGYLEQALVLKNLFVNQGFYNLFLVCTGLYGYFLAERKQFAPGYILMLAVCLFGMGAGLVLLFSTHAYALATVQTVSCALAYASLLPSYRMVSSS